MPPDVVHESAAKDAPSSAHQFSIREYDGEEKSNDSNTGKKLKHQGMKVFIIHQVGEAG
jgi:hypothetical protein